MSLIELAKKLRPLIEKAAASLDDNDALEGVQLFPAWKEGVNYEVGYRVQYDGFLYRCLTAHTALSNWTPTDAPSLWTKVLIPDSNVVPAWEQPESTNPYAKGDKVTHNGKTWISDLDGNVWEPGVYGWSEVSE